MTIFHMRTAFTLIQRIVQFNPCLILIQHLLLYWPLYGDLYFTANFMTVFQSWALPLNVAVIRYLLLSE
jgi:hypothetical protein